MESSELMKILSESNKDIDNQKLMDYLSNKLEKDEAHELERLMADSGMLNDAVEGLKQFKDNNALLVANQLNAELKKQFAKKKSRRHKRRFKDKDWIYFAVGLVLFIIAITYFLTRLHLHSQ